MTAPRFLLRVLGTLLLAAVLAGCNEAKNPGYQGWVEADMIFVSPDESGRVTKLTMREGDEVKQGDQLYSVDDDLQRADLNQNKATLANAQQTYDRAASLSKTGSGTQATLDSAVSSLRVAEARGRRATRTGLPPDRPLARAPSGRQTAPTESHGGGGAGMDSRMLRAALVAIGMLVLPAAASAT